jgi:hypothetical protein
MHTFACTHTCTVNQITSFQAAARREHVQDRAANNMCTYDVCVFLKLYVYVFIYTYACVHICIYIYIYGRMQHVNIYVCMYMYMYIYKYKYTHIHVYSHTCLHIYDERKRRILL